MSKWFEKVAALLFLLLLVGLIGFLTFVPLPEASEKAVLMVIGGLMALCTQALPKLFGADGEEECRKDIEKLRTKMEVLQDHHDRLTTLLVERHVIDKEGIISAKLKG